MSFIPKKIKSLLIVSIGGIGYFSAVCLYKGNEKFYSKYVMPVVHKFEPETAHNLAIFVNKYNLLPSSRYTDPEVLKTNVFGRDFSNPIGVAAGFDKQAEAVNGLHNLGFSFVEIGSVTPQPQEGNPKPRVFRLPEDSAIINRYGFNSDGHEIIYNRLQSIMSKSLKGVVGVNLGKNKNSADATTDYVEGIKKFAGVSDYLVINISSPNTPGLRSLQSKDILYNLLSKVKSTRDNLPENQRVPLLLKLAPDLSKQERTEIAEILNKPECKVDGLIISNTTIERKNLKNLEHSEEQGGLSGKPLSEISTEMIAEMYKLTNGMTIIGVGGVFSGEDAYEKIKAGASLVQIYTAFIYNGPTCATKIKRELARLLAKDGYNNVTEAVGKGIV